eukprot:SAG31_NODE_1095_length_9928_cov_5.441042_8_plen_1013_part_00
MLGARHRFMRSCMMVALLVARAATAACSEGEDASSATDFAAISPAAAQPSVKTDHRDVAVTAKTNNHSLPIHEAGAGASVAQWWTGVAGGARYSVLLTPWHTAAPGTAPYSIGFGAETWLRGTLPSVHCFNRWHTASDGSLSWVGAQVINGTDGEWGPFSAANVTWALRSPNASEDGTTTRDFFYTSVIHYDRADVLMFESVYGSDCRDANFTVLPSNASTILDARAHAALHPSSEFPAFAAPEDGSVRLTSEQMGFFTTGGVMNYLGLARGLGLKRPAGKRSPLGHAYTGGAQGGPLVLFEVNKTLGDADALVLSTANHHTSSVAGMRRTCSRAEWRRAGVWNLTKVAHCDLSDHDLGGIDDISEAQCADACLGAPMCNAYTYGSGGCGPGSSCDVRCYLKSSTLGGNHCDDSPASHPSPQHSGWFCRDRAEDSTLVAGPLQYLLAIPAHTAFRFLLSPLAGRGLTAAVDKWGQGLQRAARLQRTPQPRDDPVVSMLGYWTDNGAVYDGRDPLNTSSMAALFASLHAAHIPISYLQLDPYWYGHGQDMWQPDPDLYGAGGLAGLSNAINHTKLLIYHCFWNKDTAIHYSNVFSRGQPIGFSPSFTFRNNAWNTTIWQINPADADTFFEHIFGLFMHKDVMMAAEVDFLDWSQLTVPALFSTLDGGHHYLAGLAKAAQKFGISHQLCMSLPSQMMDSLLLPAVTNARASPDNVPGSFDYRYQIGYSSMLLWPLGVAPFSDNSWSEAEEPSEPYKQNRSNVELQWIISVLTAGPAGVADQKGYANFSRILQACTAHGELLHADKPATPIDAMFSPHHPYRPSGEVWQTHVEFEGLGIWRYVLAIDVDDAWPMQRAHLWPATPQTRSSNRGEMVMRWHDRHLCGHGPGCATRWPADSAPLQLRTDKPQPLPSGQQNHGFDLLVLAPIIWSTSGRGIALLGEVAKITSVSRARFRNVTTAISGESSALLSIELGGAPLEFVEVAFVTFLNEGAEPIQQTKLLQLDATGGCLATLP